MPYIKQKDRVPLDDVVDALAVTIGGLPVEAQDGSMNYAISRLLRKVYPLSYFNQNRAVGMLQCVLQEHYRRVIGPYEDTKIADNGDVLERRRRKPYDVPGER